MPMRYEGGCLCRTVRYATDAEPINERICHCRLCQRAIGASFNARLLFRVEDVSIEGPVKTYNSSEALKRGFCPECGTTLFSLRENLQVMGITAGSLDDPSLFKPAEHIWTSSRQPWLCLADGLTEHPEAP